MVRRWRIRRTGRRRRIPAADDRRSRQGHARQHLLLPERRRQPDWRSHGRSRAEHRRPVDERSTSSSAIACAAARCSPRSRTRKSSSRCDQAEASHQVAEATIRQREADLESRADQRRAVAQPVRPAAAAEADARRRRGALQRGAWRSSICRARSWRSRRPGSRSCGSTSPTPTSCRRSMASSASATSIPGAWVSQQRRRRLGRRHLVAAPGRQRRREGPAPGAAPATRRVVEVDAFPGEKFNGQIARVSPVLDPATRTAPMEVEIPNPHSG